MCSSLHLPCYKMYLSSQALIVEVRLNASHMTGFTRRRSTSGPVGSLMCSQAKRPVEERENGRDKTEPPAVEPQQNQQQQHGNERPPALLFHRAPFFFFFTRLCAAGVSHTLIKSRHLIDTLSKVSCRWTKGNRLVLQPHPPRSRSPSAKRLRVCVCAYLLQYVRVLCIQCGVSFFSYTTPVLIQSRAFTETRFVTFNSVFMTPPSFLLLFTHSCPHTTHTFDRLTTLYLGRRFYGQGVHLCVDQFGYSNIRFIKTFGLWRLLPGVMASNGLQKIKLHWSHACLSSSDHSVEGTGYILTLEYVFLIPSFDIFEWINSFNINIRINLSCRVFSRFLTRVKTCSCEKKGGCLHRYRKTKCARLASLETCPFPCHPNCLPAPGSAPQLQGCGPQQWCPSTKPLLGGILLVKALWWKERS